MRPHPGKNARDGPRQERAGQAAPTRASGQTPPTRSSGQAAPCSPARSFGANPGKSVRDKQPRCSPSPPLRCDIFLGARWRRGCMRGEIKGPTGCGPGRFSVMRLGRPLDPFTASPGWGPGGLHPSFHPLRAERVPAGASGSPPRKPGGSPTLWTPWCLRVPSPLSGGDRPRWSARVSCQSVSM